LELIFLEGHSDFTSSSKNFEVTEKKKKGHPSVVLNTTGRLQFDLHQKVIQMPSSCHKARLSNIKPCCRNKLVRYAKEKLKRTDFEVGGKGQNHEPR
jgi:hypothetical protein